MRDGYKHYCPRHGEEEAKRDPHSFSAAVCRGCCSDDGVERGKSTAGVVNSTKRRDRIHESKVEGGRGGGAHRCYCLAL